MAPSIKTWLTIITQTIFIICTVISLCYYPIKIKLNTIDAKLLTAAQEIDNQILNQNNDNITAQVIALKLEYILSILDELKLELKECQAEDRELREKIFNYLKKN